MSSRNNDEGTTIMETHTTDTILPQEIVTGMAMPANRPPVRAAMQIVLNDGRKAVDTMIERTLVMISTTHVTHIMTMSDTMNHGRHEVIGGAPRIILFGAGLKNRSRQWSLSMLSFWAVTDFE